MNQVHWPKPDPVEATDIRTAGDRAERKVFLLLQGPHGPFFDRLGRLLRNAGAKVWRCGFNAGDEFFWSDKGNFLAHTGSAADWPEHLRSIVAEKGITDIVLYGDFRPIHAAARKICSDNGLRLHVFEEGYLRPYWISYERGGSNGHSALLRIGLPEMRATLRETSNEIRRPPAHWGDMRHHKFYGALYHFLVLIANGRYREYRGHRAIPVLEEFRLNLRRFLLSPPTNLRRAIQWHRFKLSGDPYSLVLMQLEHDASFLGHSHYTKNAQFVDEVIAEFARSAPRHHHLLFKAHPLEDGRARNRLAIRKSAETHGIAGRVHYFRGGKLADMLANARSIVTVNSTAAQQALWRGLPVKAMGRAVYSKPGLVSDQNLASFLADPQPPDPASYRIFRDYLLQTSQIPGGFYSRRSRAHALRLVADLILAGEDPYESLAAGRVTYRQQIDDRIE
ncbi:capsular biosynthesis protein [Paracoccus caeni]|uniref:Capsular biosynthesis protein n=1 Tax=Paracoccus caeni TaxID=657651 RepID=A0A934VZQ7_9RHOB|nr:capsular biosynthesis protein [Paracoccus caeni]MBK4217277.1 capsular biosynthesis protein [Paracoccus caeni]